MKTRTPLLLFPPFPRYALPAMTTRLTGRFFKGAIRGCSVTRLTYTQGLRNAVATTSSTADNRRTTFAVEQSSYTHSRPLLADAQLLGPVE